MANVVQQSEVSFSESNNNATIIQQTKGCPVSWNYSVETWDAIAESSQGEYDGPLEDLPECAMFWRDDNNIIHRVIDSTSEKKIDPGMAKLLQNSEPVIWTTGDQKSIALSFEDREGKHGNSYYVIGARSVSAVEIEGEIVLAVDPDERFEIVGKMRPTCEYFCPMDQEPGKDVNGDFMPPCVIRMPAGWYWSKTSIRKKVFGRAYGGFFLFGQFGANPPFAILQSEQLPALKKIRAKKEQAEKERQESENAQMAEK